mmetsp:Transcript_15489/g.40056  ORF Transcript_15489/g.40056 Transcript_15489/m.40056 type:complete len:297 (+) Transcript_15489:160-1050(+)
MPRSWSAQTEFMSEPSEPLGQMPMTGKPSLVVQVDQRWSRWLCASCRPERTSQYMSSYASHTDCRTAPSVLKSMCFTLELCPVQRAYRAYRFFTEYRLMACSPSAAARTRPDGEYFTSNTGSLAWRCCATTCRWRSKTCSPPSTRPAAMWRPSGLLNARLCTPPAAMSGSPMLCRRVEWKSSTSGAAQPSAYTSGIFGWKATACTCWDAPAMRRRSSRSSSLNVAPVASHSAFAWYQVAPNVDGVRAARSASKRGSSTVNAHTSDSCVPAYSVLPSSLMSMARTPHGAESPEAFGM